MTKAKIMAIFLLAFLIAGGAAAAESPGATADDPWLHPYTGPTREISTRRRSTARSSAVIRAGSTRPTTARVLVSGTGARGWIGPAADSSSSIYGPTFPITTRRICARFLA